MKRLNSYGRTFPSSLSMENVRLIDSQTIMVIYQSHLFLRTICTCDGRNVRSFIIINKPLFIHNLEGFSSSILLIGTELTPSFHFTSHDCYIWQIYQGVAISLILTAVDTILILRGQSPMKSSTCACNFIFIIENSVCALSWKYCYSMGSGLFFPY